MDLNTSIDAIAVEAVTTLVYVAISVALSFAIQALTARDIGGDPAKSRDDNIGTTSSRGSVIPILVGRAALEPIVTWFGDRYASNDGTTGVRGSKPKAPPPPNDLYEVGDHILCVGNDAALRLQSIEEGSSVIWTGNIGPNTSGSGLSSHTCTDGSVFYVYWGEEDQPINARLAALTGTPSRWPYVMRIVWDKKKISRSGTWPIIKYNVTNFSTDTVLTTSPAVVGTPSGLNAAHIMARLYTAPFPFGAAQPSEDLDLNSIERWGQTMDSEDFAINAVLGANDTGKTWLTMISQECGLLIPQRGRQLAFEPVRPGSGYPTGNTGPVDFGAESMKKRPTTSIRLQTAVITTLVMTFKDERRRFRNTDIRRSLDMPIRQRGRRRRMQLSLPTSEETALKIADRTEQQEYGDQQTFDIEAIKGMRGLEVGHLFTLNENVSGILQDDAPLLRVTSRQPSDSSSIVKLKAAVDSYSVDSATQETGDGPGDAALLDTENPIRCAVLDVTAQNGGEAAISVLWIRPHNQTNGLNVEVSGSGGQFSPVGAQNVAAAGGELAVAIDADQETQIRFIPDNDDHAFLPSLSGDTLAFNNGDMVALLKSASTEEIIYVQDVLPQNEPQFEPLTSPPLGSYVKPSGTSTGFRYRVTNIFGSGQTGPTEPVWPEVLNDTVTSDGVVFRAERFGESLSFVLRGQAGTTPQAHPAGTDVFIIRQPDVEYFTDTRICAGCGVCARLLTRANGQIMPSASATIKCITMSP